MAQEKHHLFTIAKHAGLGIGGRLFLLFLRFLATLLITRTVGPELYGLLVLAMGIVTFLDVAALLGFEATMVRFTARCLARNDRAGVRALVAFGVRTSLAVSVLLATAFFLSAGVIATDLFRKAALAPVLRIMLPAIPFTAAMVLVLSVLQGAGLLRYKILVQQVFLPLMRLLFVGAAVVLGLGLAGIAWAGVLTALLGCAAAVVILTRRLDLSPKDGARAGVKGKEIFAFSVPLLFSQLLYQNIGMVGALVIGIFLASDQVGIYGVAMRVIPFLLIPLFSYNAVFSPIITDLYTKQKMSELESLFKTGNKWVMTVSLPLFAVILFFNQEIASLFGPGFGKAAPIISIVLIGHLVNVCTGSTGIILSMTGKPFYNLFNAALLCGINILLTLLLVPRYGLHGAASAYSLSLVIIQLLQMAEVWRLYRLHPYRWDSLKPVLSCAGSTACMLLLKDVLPLPNHPLSALVLALLFAAAYAAFLILSGLSSEDRLVLNKIRYRVLHLKA